MSDLISREAAISAVMGIEPLALLDYKTHKPVGAAQKTSDVIKVLEGLPTIDPVKHGHWIYTDRRNVYGGQEIVCSVCGESFMISPQTMEHIRECERYCCRCGSRMDEGSED